ncbi:MAG: ABC transporter ATP-binding protein, partial [Mycobacterium sp.]
MAPAVHFRDALALIGRFPALAGVDLDVARGEVLLLHGANGAGKTSLLRACAGLLAVVEGEAAVLGHDLRENRRAVRRQVAMFGHSTFLYDDLTVEENARFALKAAGGPVGAVAGALDRLGLVGRLRHTGASRLSSGQRRRLAMAIVLARSPEIWLLDEPHAGLDASGRQVVDELVLEAAGRGSTVLIAS